MHVKGALHMVHIWLVKLCITCSLLAVIPLYWENLESCLKSVTSIGVAAAEQLWFCRWFWVIRGIPCPLLYAQWCFLVFFFYHIWKKRNSRTSINEQKPAHTMSYLYLLCGSNRTMLKECRKMIWTDGCREPGNSHVLSLMLVQCILFFVLLMPKPKSTYISSLHQYNL